MGFVPAYHLRSAMARHSKQSRYDWSKHKQIGLSANCASLCDNKPPTFRGFSGFFVQKRGTYLRSKSPSALEKNNKTLLRFNDQPVTAHGRTYCCRSNPRPGYTRLPQFRRVLVACRTRDKPTNNRQCLERLWSTR